MVADETLIPVPAAGVLQGITPQTVLLVNSAEPEQVWKTRLGFQGRVLSLAAGSDVKERAGMATIGATCAGAAARLAGVIGWKSLAAALQTELGRYGDATVDKNLAQALAAFEATRPYAGCMREGKQRQALTFPRLDRFPSKWRAFRRRTFTARRPAKS